MFIKTEGDALINSDYIRVIFIDRDCKPHALKAECDNGDHYVLGEINNPAAESMIMDDLFDGINKKQTD